MVLRALLVLALLGPASAAAQPRSLGETAAAGKPDPAAALVEQLEAAAATGNTAAILALGVTPTVPGLQYFAALTAPAPTRVIIKERDRVALETSGDRLLIEVFAEYRGESTITTWRVDLAAAATPESPRRIAEMEQLTIVNGLFKLALNRLKQFTVHNLTVTSTDLTLEMPSGSAFVAETEEGATAVVLLGRGRMRFAPSDPAERTQARIFSGEEQVTADFDAAFVRVPPAEFAGLFPPSAITPRSVSASDVRRASDVFDD